jgi:hypothetical protein
VFLYVYSYCCWASRAGWEADSDYTVDRIGFDKQTRDTFLHAAADVVVLQCGPPSHVP